LPKQHLNNDAWDSEFDLEAVAGEDFVGHLLAYFVDNFDFSGNYLTKFQLSLVLTQNFGMSRLTCC
jgi:hypothetical protein